ncbi:WD40 repeat domain-containing protein [Sorangium sp. So ce448]|uniref:nSTAND1 domain-containing NTPase n=1 Tax=Sorangium sp. So ce448 TaxID=3133314 RepID=UPI003F6399E6
MSEGALPEGEEADGGRSSVSPPSGGRISAEEVAEPASVVASPNPFPGPQPYRAADRDRFHGRGELSYRLEASVLANRCVTVYGPSGAGKSSLMQASVIPALVDTQRLRVVRVDAWPENKEPTQWLADAVYSALSFGELPAELPAEEALLAAAQRAARKSPRIALLYLDQIEQLLYPSRSTTEVEAFFAALNRLVDTPLRGLRVVVLLREDYLGRFRDRLREHRRLLSHGFRVGPLTVAELSEAVCKAAACGQPPQTWELAPVRALMLQVRMPGQAESDDAEAQAAYAQIVCRALFQQRAQGGVAEEQEAVEAEPILRRYLEATLDELGTLSAAARRLLEDHLITADGSRTLRTEKELLRLLPAEELGPILKALEGAAILHAEEHQGSRYFEIGHDWLARRVSEARQQRELEEEQRRREEAQRRREEEQERELARERSEAAARLARARQQRRFFAVLALVAVVVAAGAMALGLYAFRQRVAAQTAAKEARAAEAIAKDKEIEASDARLLAGFRELKNSGQIAWGIKLLPEVQRPEAARGWLALASDALGQNALFVTLRGHEQPLRAVVWSHHGQRVLSASDDGTARLWSADGTGDPVVFSGHEGPINAVAFSPDDKRVLTASEEGTTRVWGESGGQIAVFDAGGGPVGRAAWSPDGARVVTASADNIARVYAVAGGEGSIELRGHTGALTAAAFFSDGARVLTASEDGTARIWAADGAGQPVILKGPDAKILFAAPSPDGTRVLTAWSDGVARIFGASGEGKPVELEGHQGSVLFAAWSADGARVATASADKTVRVWSADGTGEPVVLAGHSRPVTFVAFRPDGRYVATASLDQTARLWPSEGGKELVLAGHDGPVLSAAWSPEGTRVLTAAAPQVGVPSRDNTLRIWRPALLESLPRERRAFYHAASIGPGAELVASAYDDRAVRVWRADGAGVDVVLAQQEAWLAGAALSPDGARVAAACFDGTTRVVPVDGKGDAVSILGHVAAVRAAAWSPDGTRLVTVSDDRTARVVSADGTWDARVLSGHTDGLTRAAWSPDGQRIVTTSMDHTARVWLASGAQEPMVFKGHGGAVYSAAWSPDGQRIVTGSEDGTVQVWDATSGAVVASLDRGVAVPEAIWSPDGGQIAFSLRHGGVLLWRRDGWDRPGTSEPVLLDTQVAIISMAFLDGGKQLFTVAADNTSRTFTIDVAELRRGLVSSNADCLPASLRMLHLGEPPDRASERHAACEREHSRTPFFGEGRGP